MKMIKKKMKTIKEAGVSTAKKDLKSPTEIRTSSIRISTSGECLAGTSGKNHLAGVTLDQLTGQRREYPDMTRMMINKPANTAETRQRRQVESLARQTGNRSRKEEMRDGSSSTMEKVEMIGKHPVLESPIGIRTAGKNSESHGQALTEVKILKAKIQPLVLESLKCLNNDKTSDSHGLFNKAQITGMEMKILRARDEPLLVLEKPVGIHGRVEKGLKIQVTSTHQHARASLEVKCLRVLVATMGNPGRAYLEMIGRRVQEVTSNYPTKALMN